MSMQMHTPTAFFDSIVGHTFVNNQHATQANKSESEIMTTQKGPCARMLE